ncbi:MAG: Rrf2 family transcriptional regulator [Verrucomicrobiaceae bacterium]|nr:Rrf2 family transcriptional regulator [Verrucomicrobiaceae bacterium]
MKLSFFSDYALRILMFGALKGDVFQLDEVSKAYGISHHHLAKVVQELSKLGYLETRRGRGGGVRLARSADTIRIGKLVRETENQPAIVECFDAATNTCPISSNCQLKGALARAMTAFYDTLDENTLQELVASPQRARMIKILLPKGA